MKTLLIGTFAALLLASCQAPSGTTSQVQSFAQTTPGTPSPSATVLSRTSCTWSYDLFSGQSAPGGYPELAGQSCTVLLSYEITRYDDGTSVIDLCSADSAVAGIYQSSSKICADAGQVGNITYDGTCSLTVNQVQYAVPIHTAFSQFGTTECTTD